MPVRREKEKNEIFFSFLLAKRLLMIFKTSFNCSKAEKFHFPFHAAEAREACEEKFFALELTLSGTLGFSM
jgi:hypothetical protein